MKNKPKLVLNKSQIEIIKTLKSHIEINDMFLLFELPDSIIDIFRDEIDFTELVKWNDIKIDKEFINKYKDVLPKKLYLKKFNIAQLVKSKDQVKYLSKKIGTHSINWENISKNKLTEEFILTYQHELCMHTILQWNIELSFDAINSFQKKTFWFKGLAYQKNLTAAFVSNNFDNLDFDGLVASNNLTEEFIWKHYHKLSEFNWSTLLRNNKMTDEFYIYFFDTIGKYGYINYIKTPECVIDKIINDIRIDETEFRELIFRAAMSIKTLELLLTKIDNKFIQQYLQKNKYISEDDYTDFVNKYDLRLNTALLYRTFSDSFWEQHHAKLLHDVIYNEYGITRSDIYNILSNTPEQYLNRYYGQISRNALSTISE